MSIRISRWFLAMSISLGIFSIPAYAFANQTNPSSEISEAPQEFAPISMEDEMLAGDSSENSGNVPPEKAPEEAAQEPARRAFPAPFSSPPFPSSEWQLGGSNPIGVPDSSDPGLLMNALYKTPIGDALKASRINIYGWVDPGGNISTSKRSNAPASYDVYPNAIVLDQAILRFERKPDTVQTEHLDWGFNLTNLFGTDYRFTTMNGVFSRQLLGENHKYGYDPVMMYGEIYIPQIAQGMNIRIGRYISPPDIEAQLAPDNYMYTHSILYTVDPYTQMGILISTKLNNSWTVQAGVNGGADTAIWTDEAKLTPSFGVQWISKSGKDSIYPFINSINDGKYSYNNLQMFENTWTHKFNSRLHTATEAYYMYQRDVPASDLPANVKPGYAPEYGILNNLEYKLSDKDNLTLRNEYYDDKKGQRTGYATRYTEHAFGLTHWFNKSLTFRPEIQYDQAYDQCAFDRGRRKGQLRLAADLVAHF